MGSGQQQMGLNNADMGKDTAFAGPSPVGYYNPGFGSQYEYLTNQYNDRFSQRPPLANQFTGGGLPEGLNKMLTQSWSQGTPVYQVGNQLYTSNPGSVPENLQFNRTSPNAPDDMQIMYAQMGLTPFGGNPADVWQQQGNAFQQMTPNYQWLTPQYANPVPVPGTPGGGQQTWPPQLSYPPGMAGRPTGSTDDLIAWLKNVRGF